MPLTCQSSAHTQSFCQTPHRMPYPYPFGCFVFCIKPGLYGALLVRAPDSRSKGCEFESRQERRENFLLQSQRCVLTLILCPFQPRVTAVARKRPRSLCQKHRWQVTPKHAYTLDPTKSEWADYAAVQAQCGNLSETKSHATCQETFGHSRLTWMSHSGLILA